MPNALTPGVRRGQLVTTTAQPIQLDTATWFAWLLTQAGLEQACRDLDDKAQRQKEGAM